MQGATHLDRMRREVHTRPSYRRSGFCRLCSKWAAAGQNRGPPHRRTAEITAMLSSAQSGGETHPAELAASMSGAEVTGLCTQGPALAMLSKTERASEAYISAGPSVTSSKEAPTATVLIPFASVPHLLKLNYPPLSSVASPLPIERYTPPALYPRSSIPDRHEAHVAFCSLGGAHCPGTGR